MSGRQAAAVRALRELPISHEDDIGQGPPWLRCSRANLETVLAADRATRESIRDWPDRVERDLTPTKSPNVTLVSNRRESPHAAPGLWPAHLGPGPHHPAPGPRRQSPKIALSSNGVEDSSWS